MFNNNNKCEPNQEKYQQNWLQIEQTRSITRINTHTTQLNSNMNKKKIIVIINEKKKYKCHTLATGVQLICLRVTPKFHSFFYAKKSIQTDKT